MPLLSLISIMDRCFCFIFLVNIICVPWKKRYSNELSDTYNVFYIVIGSKPGIRRLNYRISRIFFLLQMDNSGKRKHFSTGDTPHKPEYKKSSASTPRCTSGKSPVSKTLTFSPDTPTGRSPSQKVTVRHVFVNARSSVY